MPWFVTAWGNTYVWDAGNSQCFLSPCWCGTNRMKSGQVSDRFSPRPWQTSIPILALMMLGHPLPPSCAHPSSNPAASLSSVHQWFFQLYSFWMREDTDSSDMTQAWAFSGRKGQPKPAHVKTRHAVTSQKATGWKRKPWPWDGLVAQCSWCKPDPRKPHGERRDPIPTSGLWPHTCTTACT